MRYYTYRRQVPKPPPGWHVDFRKGKGYYLVLSKPVVSTPAPPPVVHVPVPFRPVLLTAWGPRASHDWPYRIAISADRSFRSDVLAFVAEIEDVDRKGDLIVWGDCKPAQTPVSEVKALAAELGLPWMGEAEVPEAARAALDAGATELIGNAAGLTPQLRAEIVAHGVTFHQEAYWGDGQGPPSTVSAMGIPARLAPGIYSACRAAADYVRDLPALAQADGPLGAIYLAEGGDWSPLVPR